ncbi:MAG TPA: lamin tail domain-containing protein, partial [Candidatus Limnocylindria bacterium]|nr:lamin tail domain-containing protein [Candidatus Limnocylindria bacterium]
MTASGGGTIYYTTNGADPRVMFSGAVSNAAVAYAGPVALSQSAVVKARSLIDGTNWSAVTEATFAVATIGPSLRITEINYNPGGSTAYEFIELQNISSAPIDLSGMNFQGVTFTFPNFSTLAGGARLVLASDFDPAAFAVRYPGVTVRGYFSDSLNNGGERITLRDSAGNVITSLDYDDGGGWPATADGGGYALEIVNPFGDPDDPANWRASTTLGGTPGAVSTLPVLGAVRLNEVLAENLAAVNHSGTFPDFVELGNTSGAPIDLSGWSLTDDVTAPAFVFPPGSTIAANGYLTIWCDAATNTTPGLHSGFSLGRNGENVFLYNASGNLADALTFGLQLPDYSVGRSGNDWVLSTPTPTAANVAVTVGAASNLSINEFLANAFPGNPDWIELFNDSALPVALRGTFLSNTSAVHQVTSLSFIAPFGFVQLFADEGTGPDHLDFKLPATGGAIVLYNNVAAEVNRVTYGAQGEGVSRGRLPDGNANIVNFPGTSSPSATNYIASYSGPVLNEVFARNVSAVTNAAGRVADYVELYNASANPFALAGFSLSVNALEPGQWIFPPSATIPGQSYLVIWCDDGQPTSTNTPIYNVGQALDGASGGVYLFNPAGQLVNSVEYGFQVVDRSIGLVASAWRLLAAPTPGAANGSAATLGVTTTLRINEWMAQPDSGPDWFEVFNGTNLPVDLTGLLLTDDPSSSGTNSFRIAPLSFIGASNFVQCLADSQPDQGRNHVSFNLDTLGDTIRIYTSSGASVIDTVVFGVQAFTTSQGRMPDGGSTIVSFPGAATPGEANYRLLTEVAINEILTHANSPLEDTIELRNIDGLGADVSGWFLSDNASVPKKFRIANGTTLGANGFVLISESQFNTGVSAFSLDRARGGELWLSAADSSGNLTGFRTGVKFGAAAEGVSFGSYQASGGAEFVAQNSRTLPGANAGPLVGPVVINELMYHPPDGVAAATEFIELRNITGAPVNLFDPARPTNTWRLGDG